MSVLSITCQGDGESAFHLVDAFPRGDGIDFALHERADGAQVLVRSVRRGAVRTVDRFRVGSGAPRALDRTVFEIDADRFAEISLRRSERGDNLHLRPIELPGTLELDVEHQVLEGASVRLAWAGPAKLELGRTHTTRRVCCLVGSQRGEERAQWLAEGIGEIAIGPRGGVPSQWLVGWARGSERVFGGIDAALREAPLPHLPDDDEERPREDLF